MPTTRLTFGFLLFAAVLGWLVGRFDQPLRIGPDVYHGDGWPLREEPVCGGVYWQTVIIFQRLISQLSKRPRKYALLQDDTVAEKGQTLYRIRAVRDFGPVRKGELGGYIASERNLSHRGRCWVMGNARVCDRAHIWGDAMVGRKATVKRKSKGWRAGVGLGRNRDR